MKKKALILASTAIITVASIGGYAFAQGNNEVEFKNQDRMVKVEELTTKYNNQEDKAIQESVMPRNYNNQQSISNQEDVTPERYNDHCINDEEMIQIMNENGLEDMVKWMEEGNFGAMDDFMNNMSEEDYEKMIDLMDQYGYGNMSNMMESIDREDMVNMHNSMMGGRGHRSNGSRNMMGRFQ